MRHFFIGILVSFLLNGTLTGQTGCQKQILKAELLRFEAMTRKDTQALSRLLSADLIYLHSNGLQENKQQHLDAIASGTIVYRTMYRQPDSKVRQYGKTALVNGMVIVNGDFQGKSFSVNLLYTAVYRRQKRQWRLANWQSTRVENR